MIEMNIIDRLNEKVEELHRARRSLMLTRAWATAATVWLVAASVLCGVLLSAR